jgi:hypothetical protein
MHLWKNITKNRMILLNIRMTSILIMHPKKVGTKKIFKIGAFIMIYFFINCIVLGCKKDVEQRIDFSELINVTKAEFTTISNKRIFFGHQSVGANIMQGLDYLLTEAPSITLRIKETNSITDFIEPVFAHYKIGKNGNPQSKCDAFKAVMDSGIGSRCDVAFFKFCYIDIDETTDIDSIFKYYQKTISDLEKEYPMVEFLHCTVPLRSKNTDFWAATTRLIHLRNRNDEANSKRNKFNKKLADFYEKKVFNLAYFESHFGEVSDKENKVLNCSLSNSLTEDGGHLNLLGKKYIAMKMLFFLKNILD